MTQPLWDPSIPVVAAIDWRAPAIKPPDQWRDTSHYFDSDVNARVAEAVEREARQIAERARGARPQSLQTN